MIQLDQMIISAQHCISNDPFFDRYVLSESQPGQIYTVRINYPNDPPSEWTCTCPSFTFRGRCKHIDQMSWQTLCLWHELDSNIKQTEEQKQDHICPNCGNMTSETLEDDDS